MPGQFAVGLLSDKFVARVTAPEIYAADLEKLAGGAAEELDQSGGVRALRSLGCDPQQESLKVIVGGMRGLASRRRRRIASD